MIASYHIPSDLHVLGLPLAFILSQDQTLHCIMSSFITDPIINNRICKIIPSTVSLLSSLITNHPIPLSFPLQAVTLHDYLSFLRTLIVLCRREPFLKIPEDYYFFNLLPRSRSGCKDAINFNACQVLFSLIFSLFFSR